MAESMKGLKRTHYCGDLRLADEGKEVVVGGWVQKQRDKGTLVFVDLRDRTGIVQLTFDDRSDPAVHEKAAGLHSEYVVIAKGTVLKREAPNPDIPTGDVEIFVTELRVLSEAQTPPFHISGDNKVNDEIRLKYRYLDLRRKTLQDNLRIRHEIAKSTREYFYENGFLEIETPMMMKSTPEGARDYLVPSRVHNGKFYALPQSPQIYKQLLMIAGYDRYIQLARCFRDEDLRADRQPEFTQIDMEMSFVDIDDVLEIGEGFVKKVFQDVLHVDVPTPLPRMTYQEAMERFGSDKPDTRFGMEIMDVSDLVKDSEFGVFQNAVENGGSVRAIVAKNAASALTRKNIDKLVEYVRGIGAKGLAFVRWADETPSCSFSKFMKEGELEAILERLGCEKGDVALFVADKNSVTLPVLGALRLTVAKQLDIIPEGYNFLWITEFPFFEWDEEQKTWVAMHHPFTMPMDECLEYMETDPGRVRAKAYDLVLNGTELSSGSIRITDPVLQQKMFEALGLSKKEIEAKFGFLVDAYQYGAPPHGGMGIGLDRLAMIMTGAESLRDVVAFPKVQNASELMSECPSTVDEQQLRELGIQLIQTEE
ncbi:aspartate--tRNA ligase [Massilimaliae timonensis]|uniref:Aspartate--tRNA ligase n=1 Tax=Massiliimalia timonensis TaxID=1987501 RepID=A0A8J6PBD4_9FIRM|nr:aspartate--tRNA ligase [Massiliimalia timonensis]MBC8610927.1 aspartate--tRNA ligase [Massiliimalia timonensis]